MAAIPEDLGRPDGHGPRVLALSVCCAAVAFFLASCGPREPVRARVEEAVLSLPLEETSRFRYNTSERGQQRLVELARAYENRQIVEALRSVFYECNDPKDKMRVAVATRYMKESLRSRPWNRELALALFESRVPLLIIEGLRQLEDQGHEGLENLVQHRLETTPVGPVHEWLLRFLVRHGIFGPLRKQLSLSRPPEGNAEAISDWRERILEALMMCFEIGMADRLPPEIGEDMAAVIDTDPVMARRVVHEMLPSIPPENVKRALQPRKDLLPSGSIPRIWVDAALLIVDKNPDEAIAARLEALREVVERYAEGDDCWIELVSRANALSFVAACRRNETLFRNVWETCRGMHLRDRAEVLSLMAKESYNHGTNECILFLNTIPLIDLERMNVLVKSQLAIEAEGLARVSELRSIPAAVSEQEMRAAVKHLSDAFPGETHFTYSGVVVTLGSSENKVEN